MQELIKMPLGKPVETIRTRNGSGGSGGWAGKDINGWRSGRCWLVTRTKRSLLTIRNTQMDIKFLAMVWLEPKGEGERTSNSNTNITGPNESAAGICTTRAPCYVTIVIGTSISPSMEWRHVVNRVFVFCHKGCDNIRSGHNGTCWWWVADFMQITSGHIGNTLIGSRWMNEAHRDWLSTGGRIHLYIQTATEIAQLSRTTCTNNTSRVNQQFIVILVLFLLCTNQVLKSVCEKKNRKCWGTWVAHWKLLWTFWRCIGASWAVYIWRKLITAMFYWWLFN